MLTGCATYPTNQTKQKSCPRNLVVSETRKEGLDVPVRADLVHAACLLADMQKVIQGKSGSNPRLKGSDLDFFGEGSLLDVFVPLKFDRRC